MRDQGCSSFAVRSVHPSAKDILRLEPFGGFYYRRHDSTFHAFTPQDFALLVLAKAHPLTDAYKETQALQKRSPEAFATLLCDWQGEGFLDDEFRCHAELRQNPAGEKAASAPLITHMELTQACNLRCSHCFVPVMAKRADNELSLSQLDAFFAELNALGAPRLVLAGGEPMIRPDIIEVLQSAQRHELDTRFCTNGTLINKSNAEALVKSGVRCFSVSIDGPNAEIHERLRGAKRFAQALRGIDALLNAGADDVQLRVTLSPLNIDSLDDFAGLAKRIGVHRVVFKPFRQSGVAGDAHEHHIDRQELLFKTNQAHERWPEDAPLAEFFDGMPTRPPEWTQLIPSFGCVGGTTSATVTFDGHVTGCGPAKSAADWTLHDHAFGDIWRGAPTMMTWRTLEGNDGCRGCGEFKKCAGGCRVRALAVTNDMNSQDPWAYCSDDKSPTGALHILQ